MTQGYNQFCPVALAAEILCTRWTVVLLRELVAGSARFNDLRRGLPRMSPALLSQRLKELEAADIICRTPSPTEPGVFEYRLTASGRALGVPDRGVRNLGPTLDLRPNTSLEQLDASLLMWDMRRNLNPTTMLKRRCVIRFQYPELSPKQRLWWILVGTNAEVDLCLIDPGFDVDLFVSTDLRTMTAIWMGLDNVRNAKSAQRLMLTGDRKLAADMQTWLGLSPLAKVQKLAS